MYSQVIRRVAALLLVGIVLAACGQHAAPPAPSAPFAVTSYGPRSQQAGTPFNAQPDGSSAAWFKMSQSMDGSIAWVHFGDANIQADISGNMVTIKVPPELYESPRDVVVTVEKVDGDKKTVSPPVTIAFIR